MASGRSTYDKLSPALSAQLSRITPSTDGYFRYFPCQVALSDGRKQDRVYLTDAASYSRSWTPFPSEDRGKREVLIGNVVGIEDSPSRLPADIANRIYGSGESGMGYIIFTLVFEDGSRLPCSTGDAVDFVALPQRYIGLKVRDVELQVGREQINAGAEAGKPADYSWCIYSL